MLKRLFVELGEAFQEFRDGPRAFIASAIQGDSRAAAHRTTPFRLGLTIALLLYALALAATILLGSLNHQNTGSADHQPPLFVFTPLPHLPSAKMPEGDGESGGGGGGGRNKADAPSGGDLPIFALTNLVVAPRPEDQLRPPALPFPETVKVEPRIQVERDDLVPTGLPDGTSLLPSAGPGSDRGIGSGSRGGIGDGDGYGAGSGYQHGIGGGWPSGFGRRKRDSQLEAVDARPVLLNSPQPLFTEAARKNKIQGVVRVRILVGSNGSVREVVLIRGLPDGLNEQAIRAAYQMRFRPATKNGQPVAFWVNNVEVEFNLR
jgi:TonB family protein